MDVNDVRVAVTVAGLVLFLALWVWTWNRKRKSAFDEAARLPFAGDDLAQPSNEQDRRVS
jgi:cytochrome c oxidase cbb3-type subunit 4